MVVFITRDSLIWDATVRFHRTDGLMGLLGSLGLGPVLAGVGILLAELVDDELLRGAEGEGGEVRRVGTHVGDQTALVEGLRHPHRRPDREMKFPGSLLLEGGRRERGGRDPGALLLFHRVDPVGGADAVLEEALGLLQGVEAGVQERLDLHGRGRPFRMEDGLYLIIWFAAESHDLLFPVHDQAEGDALHTAGGKLRLDLAPQDGGEFEAYQAVQHAARLLRVDKVSVDVAGMLDRIQDGRLGDFMEHDPPRLRGVEGQGFGQVPGNGFSFAVLIGREPHGLGAGGEFLQFGNDLLLVGRYYIFGLESMFHIHAQLLLLQVADMADACFYQIVIAQELLNSLDLPGRLDDD